MKNTDLIDRYLQAVQFWLPKNDKRDIIQELSEDLRSQIEEKEAMLGYELNEDEIAGFLKRRGRPILMASRYFPQEHLIGPTLFPVYKFVLRMAALCYFLPWILVWISLMIFDGSYRARHAGIQLFGDWGWFWLLVMFVFSAITTVFAVVERALAKDKFLEGWDPRDLPKLRQQRKPFSRTQNFVELFFNANFVVWWLAVGHYPHTFFGFASELFRPAAGLGAYYWPMLGVALVNIAQQITNAFRPQWTWLRPATLFATNGTLVVLFGFLLRIKPLVVLQEPYAHVDRYVKEAPIVNTVLFWTVFGIATGMLVACCVYGYQLLKLYRGRQRRPGAPVAVQIL